MDIRADLHIHTVLSPCGDLEMSPENILHFAQIQGLNMIGITDHNSTRQAPIIRDYGKTKGIFVLTGAEICSKEEVHALTFSKPTNSLLFFSITWMYIYPIFRTTRKIRLPGCRRSGRTDHLRRTQTIDFCLEPIAGRNCT